MSAMPTKLKAAAACRIGVQCRRVPAVGGHAPTRGGSVTELTAPPALQRSAMLLSRLVNVFGSTALQYIGICSLAGRLVACLRTVLAEQRPLPDAAVQPALAACHTLAAIFRASHLACRSATDDCPHKDMIWSTAASAIRQVRSQCL